MLFVCLNSCLDRTAVAPPPPGTAPLSSALSSRTISGNNAASGPVTITYNLAAPSDEDRIFWRNEIHHAIRTQPRVRALLTREPTQAEIAARKAASPKEPSVTTAGHVRQRSMSETDKRIAANTGGISTPSLTALAEHGSTPPQSGGNTPPLGSTPVIGSTTPLANAIPARTVSAQTPSTLTSSKTPVNGSPPPSPLLSIQTSSSGALDRVMPLPPSQSLRSVYVFALLANSRKGVGQDQVLHPSRRILSFLMLYSLIHSTAIMDDVSYVKQILCRTALFMNESLVRFGGFELRLPDGSGSPTSTSSPPTTRPVSMSLATVTPSTTASVAQAYFMNGIALQFSTVAAAIHWCVKLQARVATLSWKKNNGSDGKEEKTATTSTTAAGAKDNDSDGGPRLCLGIHVHTRSLSIEGETGEEDDDDEKSITPATATSPLSPSSSSSSMKESKSENSNISRGLKMAQRVARTAVAGQTLCSREVWRIWGQTIENREIRRSRIEARESGDVAMTVRGEDVKDDDDDEDDDDVGDRSDDDALHHPTTTTAATTAATSTTNTSGSTTPQSSTTAGSNSGTNSAVGSLQSSSSTLLASGSGVMIGVPAKRKSKKKGDLTDDNDDTNTTTHPDHDIAGTAHTCIHVSLYLIASGGCMRVVAWW
jgi:hypothetical protein